HQKEALDFVTQRETGNLPSELSLWKRNEIDADEPFFQHVFTGAKRPQQDEAPSGIIADEMGLGKSLVIISTISGSLDRAKEFVTTEDQQPWKDQKKMTRSGATLVIAPSSLLIDSWVDELRKHTYPGSLSFHKHLGQSRHAETHLLCEKVIIFTTYATVAAEYCKGNSTLAKINWFRIVLDEAHDIRNSSTKQFQAVSSLSAKHRWCLSGTPIQNDLEDLGALVSFLRVPVLENGPTFRKFITNPILSNTSGRFQNLRTLLQTICIRRTREIDMAVSGYANRKVNSTVLESLLKLRLFCNNGSARSLLAIGPDGLPMDADEFLSYLQQSDQNICTYCSSIVYTIDNSADTDGGRLMSTCAHLICRNCIIVFSSWKVTLSLVGKLLRHWGLRYDSIDGSLKLAQRKKVLDDFRSPKGANILLMTLGTSAVGLNLAVASRIYLLEPQWNPSIESQAIGRAVRLGQTDQVIIKRYVMENTIEEVRICSVAVEVFVRLTSSKSNVLSRQQRKLQLAGGGFGKEGMSERFQSMLVSLINDTKANRSIDIS
ncbi:hypothetical protein NA57DRAFT_35076, partial [Rhizodiscina lignyota]